ALADMAISPFVRQFARTDAHWFESQPWPALHAWLAAIVGSPDFARVMCKQAKWSPGDAPVRFPDPEP
ncbi:MAG: hypothetical protein K8F27_14440, partial [Sulfuricellaceae bacterium]|nr:hypothetical protein [Sulfuricellaceae bacterium]